LEVGNEGKRKEMAPLEEKKERKKERKLSNSYGVCTVDKRVGMGGMWMLNPPRFDFWFCKLGDEGPCLPAWEEKTRRGRQGKLG
jgi:hypothetical protein